MWVTGRFAYKITKNQSRAGALLWVGPCFILEAAAWDQKIAEKKK